jgi:hypothetical protein
MTGNIDAASGQSVGMNRVRPAGVVLAGCRGVGHRSVFRVRRAGFQRGQDAGEFRLER